MTVTCTCLPVPRALIATHGHRSSAKEITKMSLFLSTRIVQWVRCCKEIINVFVFLCLTFKHSFFFLSQCPFSFLLVFNLLLNLYPFLSHYLSSPVNQFYSLLFPRIINIVTPLFIFPDFFLSICIFIYHLSVYVCVIKTGTKIYLYPFMCLYYFSNCMYPSKTFFSFKNIIWQCLLLTSFNSAIQTWILFLQK